jgi:hypothetical protein
MHGQRDFRAPISKARVKNIMSEAPFNKDHRGEFNKNADFCEFDGRPITEEENRIAAEKLRGIVDDARGQIKE